MTDALLVHFNLLPRMALVAAYVQIRDREIERERELVHV